MVFAGAIILAVVALAIVATHHIAYFRRVRGTTFGAFLETGGWLILLLVAIGVVAGGLQEPGTTRVEAAAAIVGVLCVIAGWRLRKRMGRGRRP